MTLQAILVALAGACAVYSLLRKDKSMGEYINIDPDEGTKEEWLITNGKLLDHTPHGFTDTADSFFVCLVDNGPFTAASIMYDETEHLEFTRSDDVRPRKYYSVSKDKLLGACPSLKGRLSS